MKEIECLVRGRVTGVMFRDFVERRARQLGLVGTVENLSVGQAGRVDQSVRVVAQGETKTLREFISYLERGSFLSQVDKVEVFWREPGGGLENFHIIY